jgi:MFS family permease
MVSEGRTFAGFRSAFLEARRPFAVCLVAVALSTADQSLFSYAIPEIKREFGIGLDVIGQMLSASFLVASVAVVLVGLLSDRYGRKRILVTLLGISALCVAAQSLAYSLGALAVLRVIGFSLGAGLYPIANTIVVEAAPARYRGLIAGLLQIGYPLGFAFAALIATPIMEQYGWRAIFLVGLAILVIAPWLSRLLPESSRFGALAARGNAQQSWTSRLGDLWRLDLRARTIVCFLGSFLVSLAIGGTTYFLPVYLVEAHGLTASAAGRIAGSAYAIGAVGYIAASLVGEFVTTRRNALVAWICVGATAFALTLWTDWVPLVAGLGAMILFCYGSEALRMPMIAELFPTEVRATACAAAGSLAVTTAWLIAPLAVSMLAPKIGWAAAFTYCAVIPLVGGAAAFLLLENRSNGAPLEERILAAEQTA